MSISVLIIGASGAFGQPLLQEFIKQQPAFKCIAVLASSDKKATTYSWAEAKGVKIVVGSFLAPKSYSGFTHVISVVGNAILRLQPAMIEAALEAGVTHFYPSEWNSDISQREIYALRYFRDKQVTRSHLVAKAREYPGFRYTIFVTGIFTEWAVGEFYGFDHEKAEVVAYGRPEARLGVTSIPDIARYTVTSLLIPWGATTASGSERTIRVQGTNTTFQGLVDALGAARGVKYSTKYVSPAEAATKEEQARLAGDEVDEMVWSIRPLIASGFGVADGGGAKLDTELFDFIPETMEETFRRVYD